MALKKLPFIFLFLLPLAHFGQDAPKCPGCPDWFNFDASGLEDALQRPHEIHSLDMAMQKVKIVDARIGLLDSLECLDLSFNQFPSLPPEFANLKNLRCLKIAGCRFLTGVPSILKELPKLEFLDLRDHPEWGQKQYDDAKAMLPNVVIVR